MIDGLKLLCPNVVVNRWDNVPEITNAMLSVPSSTAEVVQRKATYHGLTFTSTTSQKTGAQKHIVTGSLHRYYNKGGDNCNQFFIQDLITAIDDLTERFSIDPTSTLIQTLEIGINLSLPYSPTKVIDSMVVCSNKPYSRQVDEKRPGLGLAWAFDDHEVKIYDKGRLFGYSDKNQLRVEVRVRKMRFLKEYNVQTLDDLRNPVNVVPLVAKLVEAIERIEFVDLQPSRLDLLTDAERVDFYRLQRPHAWKRKRSAVFEKDVASTRWQRQDNRERLVYILDKCEAFDFKNDLIRRIIIEWNSLVDQSRLAHVHTAIDTVTEISQGRGEAHEAATFTPLDYLGVNVVFPQTVSPSIQTANSIIEPPPNLIETTSSVLELAPDRVCVSCGKTLTSQLSSSRFCSEKYNGRAAARRCRNIMSNQRRSKKNLILKAQGNNQYVRIHFWEDGIRRTDVLHSSTVSVTGISLDKIISLSAITEVNSS
ncbi:hypothetical protein J2I47_19265 [Fibrella sp. HMF5335]|uniref:Uncharacterized protein n=1 Tax=Fibrella rubiginis TaxID=2817060 RepID=A0A939GK29_9BACT|nr:hypothetical protein [Fibrella rubiginis]MBO0938699.1 hypothetical protein [Fibrella rubiginis]